MQRLRVLWPKCHLLTRHLCTVTWPVFSRLTSGTCGRVTRSLLNFRDSSKHKTGRMFWDDLTVPTRHLSTLGESEETAPSKQWMNGDLTCCGWLPAVRFSSDVRLLFVSFHVTFFIKDIKNFFPKIEINFLIFSALWLWNPTASFLNLLKFLGSNSFG